LEANFITSKCGNINEIGIYRYEFSSDLLRQDEQLNKFQNWLLKTEEIFVYKIDKSGFSTFVKMNDLSTWQYKFVSSTESCPPFQNTQKISSFISHKLRTEIEKYYKRYLNKNIYVQSKIRISPFTLLKTFEFNVEVFETGKYYVHFIPKTKVVSERKIDIDYFSSLIRQIEIQDDDELNVTIVSIENFKRTTIDLSDISYKKSAEVFLTDNPNTIATFNYHFIATLSSSKFRQLVDETNKEIDKSIYFLKEILSEIEFSEFFNFQKKPFKIIEMSNCDSKNLVVGGGALVNKQSAAYHSGIYKPADDFILQPIFIDYADQNNNLKNLFKRFNGQNSTYTILDTLHYKSNDENIFTKVSEEFLSRKKSKFIVAIFTKYKQPPNFLTKLKKDRIPYQLFLGQLNNHKLSNFVVKCLEKLGGKLSVINDTLEPKSTYFVGIGLGHSKSRENRFTNLGLTFFNNKGELIHSFVHKNLPLNEAITNEMIWKNLASFRTKISKSELTKPKKIIFHRDGKMHKSDESSIVKHCKRQLQIDNVEIVEIIKYGYPIIAKFEDGIFCNPKSGDYYLDIENKYAILVTNVQASSKNSILNPIVIKHKRGNTKLDQIVDQVYWFTRIYTNNLYNSSRLPATTLKANNIVGTSIKRHNSTYEG